MIVPYHCTHIVTNSCEKEWQHSKEIKQLSEPVYIPAKDLFSISTCYFPFK